MAASGSILGNAVQRLEDPTLLTGSGKYVDDLVEPNMAHVVFVRSPIAHANVTSVDVERGDLDAGRGRRVSRRWRRPRRPEPAGLPDDARHPEPARVRQRQGALRRRHRCRGRGRDSGASHRRGRGRGRRLRPAAFRAHRGSGARARRSPPLPRARLEHLLRHAVPRGRRLRPDRPAPTRSPRSPW